MMIVMFSLNKWEMLYNGTGMGAFPGIRIVFLELCPAGSGVRKGIPKREKSELVLLFVLPFVITIGAAGPYCAIYTVTIVMAYLFIYVRDIVIAKSLSGKYQAKADRQNLSSTG